MVQPASKQMRPCELYLVRHGVAAERGDDWPDDTKRPLTASGVSRFREVVEGLVWFGVGIDEIYSSPLVRAHQTADLLSAGLAITPPCERSRNWRRGTNRPSFWPSWPSASSAGALRWSATSRTSASSRQLFWVHNVPAFRKGGVCRIDVDRLGPAAAGSLISFFPPKIQGKRDDKRNCYIEFTPGPRIEGV